MANDSGVGTFVTAGANSVALGGAGDDVLVGGGPLTYVAALAGVAGVSGTVSLAVAGDQVTVTVDATGIGAANPPTLELHGGVDPATGLPVPSTADALGPVLASLATPPNASVSSDGGLHFSTTLSLGLEGQPAANAGQLLPLDLRSVVLAGADGQPLAEGQVHTGPQILLFPVGGFPNGVLVGGAGNDVLVAGPGDAMLVGGTGNDVLVSGRGNDVMTGGPGADLYVLSPGHDTISDFRAAEGDRLALPGGMDSAQVAASAHDTPDGTVLNLPNGGGDLLVVGIHDPAHAADWFQH